MHTLHLTASPVAALQSLPGGGHLYVTPSLTQQQQGQLVAALQALYAQDPQPPPVGAAAGPAAAPTRAAADGAEPAAKRACVEQPKQQRRVPGTDAKKLSITVQDQLGRSMTFWVLPHTLLQKVCAAFAERHSLDLHEYGFWFDGERVQSYWTPEHHEVQMQDGDVIDCILQQVGC